MLPIIKAYSDPQARDVVYLNVNYTDQVGMNQWYLGHDGQFTMTAPPDTIRLSPIASDYGQFYHGTRPSKFLPGTVFLLNAAHGADIDSFALEVHERKKHGIAPLYGAPRRTLQEVAKLTRPFAVPLTRKFSDDAMVPGAQLTADRGCEAPAIVLEVRIRGVSLMLPGALVPYSASISNPTFTQPTTVPAIGYRWARDTPDLVPVPQGNCELLLPGTQTNKGVVINLTSTSVTLESNDGSYSRVCYTLHLDPNNPGRMFIDTEEVPVITALAAPQSARKTGELWESWTGEHLYYSRPGQVTLIAQDLLAQFWNGDQVPPIHRASADWLHTDNQTYPCASMLALLPKHRVAQEYCWHITQDGPGAKIQTFSDPQPVLNSLNWSGLPVARSLFVDPEGLYHDIPSPARLAAQFTCGLCGEEGQDRHTSEVVQVYPHSSERAHIQRLTGSCCLGPRRAMVTQCPTCRSYFHVARETRTRNTTHCPSCTIAGAVSAYHSYSYKPAPKFFGTGPLFFGVELELKTTSPLAMMAMANRVADSASGDLVYAKTDSSIGEYGLEFVTHPFSLEHVQANPQLLGSLMGHIEDNDDWMAASSCGIHIHTSKKGYSVLRSSIPGEGADKLTEEQLLTRGIFRAQKFVYGNPKLITHFAGRDSSRYASLAVAPGRDQTDARITGARDALRLCREHGASKPLRYSAMNFTKDTIEYRVFKSTTSIAELMRNIYFIDSIVQYARHHAMPKTKAPDLAPYRQFLETQPYYESVRTHFDAWTGAKKVKPIQGIAPGRSDVELMNPASWLTRPPSANDILAAIERASRESRYGASGYTPIA